jgi:hypothetical protein
MSNPLVISGVIEALLVAILGIVNAWYPLTGTQNSAILVLIAAIVGALTWWVNRRMVEVSKLKTPEGESVTKEAVTRGAIVTWNE